MRLAVDFAQIELALSPFCRRLTDLGKHYKILKAFRSLLILDSEVFLTNSSVGDVVPFDLVLHHLICRSPNELRSPHQVEKLIFFSCRRKSFENLRFSGDELVDRPLHSVAR